MSDPFEVVGYVIGFWRYLFSPRFRRRKDREWRAEARTRRGGVLVSIEILVATAIGLGLPILVLWWILG